MPQTVTQAVYASDYTSLGMGVGEGVNMCGRRPGRTPQKAKSIALSEHQLTEQANTHNQQNNLRLKNISDKILVVVVMAFSSHARIFF